MPPAPSPRYTAVAILLHWTLAVLLIFMIGLGWNMEDNANLFQLHKSVGILILVLTVARILWRAFNPPPPLPDDMTPWEKALSHAVHKGFYALMLLLPLLGWLVVSTSDKQVPTLLFKTIEWPHLPFTEGLRGGATEDIAEFLHSKGAWVLIVLLGLHVAGAVKHQMGAEEGVFKRMIPGLAGATSPPRPARGWIAAFGGALAFFGIIAAMPLLSSSAAPVPAATTEDTGDWDLSSANAEIRFSGTYQGDAFTGVFEDWRASVVFDPEAAADAAILVTVQTGSATTGDNFFDKSLKEGEWFDIAAHPTATVRLTHVQPVEQGFAADAVLTIKGKEITAPLAFTVTFDGDTATLAGGTRLARTELDLGQNSDAGAEYVSDDIEVSFSGTAQRK